MRPDEGALEELGDAAVAEEAGQRVGDGGPGRSPLVQTERDPRRVPEQQRRDDPRDQREDQVGLAEVAALEAGGSLDLADREGADHADEHQHGEHVHHQGEPALVAEPGQRGVAAYGADHRDQDRGEEDEEAPEDRSVDQARHETLEQLLLAEHDQGLVLDALRNIVEALDRLAQPHQVHEQLRAAAEQRAADREHRGERERSEHDVYEDCAFLSSAVIAGTISARSPITA
jgi:hypothetical protein